MEKTAGKSFFVRPSGKVRRKAGKTKNKNSQMPTRTLFSGMLGLSGASGKKLFAGTPELEKMLDSFQLSWIVFQGRGRVTTCGTTCGALLLLSPARAVQLLHVLTGLVLPLGGSVHGLHGGRRNWSTLSWLWPAICHCAAVSAAAPSDAAGNAAAAGAEATASSHAMVAPVPRAAAVAAAAAAPGEGGAALWQCLLL